MKMWTQAQSLSNKDKMYNHETTRPKLHLPNPQPYDAV